MNRLKKILIFLVIVVSKYTTQAQSLITIKTNIQLEGLNCDDPKQTIRKFDIQEIEDKLKVVKQFETTKCEDSFTIDKKLGVYKAIINVNNYYTEEITFEIDASSNTINLNASLFKTDKVNNLDQVTIATTINNPIKNEGNKTTFSVANNNALNSGTALETIQKLPGVLTDLTGNITLKGKAVTIYIDGLPTNLGGQDLTNYLNSISSSTLSKVEIINNPGASFDADTRADVINVVTNQKNKKGINGNTYVANVFHRRTKYIGALSLNGLYNKVNWNFSLMGNDVDYENSANRTIVNKTENDNATDYSFNDGKNKPLSLKVGFGFPFKKNKLNVNYSFFGFEDNIKNTANFESNANGTITKQNSNGNQNNNSKRNEIVAFFVHDFKKEGQNLTFNYQFYDFNRDTNSYNQSVLNTNQTYNNIAINDFQSRYNKIKADFVLPLKIFKITTGIKVGNATIISKGNYSNSLSNFKNAIDFNYKDNTVAAYSEFYKRYKSFDFTAGLRFEHIQLESVTNDKSNQNQEFNNFFPSFNASYTINNMTGLNLSYSRKVRLPGYQELDPNTSVIPNNFITDGGNPLLNPSFSDNIEFKFNYLTMGYVSLSYSKADIENYAVIIKENGAYKQTITQFQNIESYNASWGMPFPLGIITKGMAYTRTITDISKIDYIYFYSGINYPKYSKDGYNNSFKPLYYVGASSQFVLPFDTTMNLSYTYTSPGNYTIYNLDKSFYRFNLVLSKTLFKKSTKLQFSIDDIFNTANGINGSLNNNNINLNLRTYSDTQRFKFAISYNFGKYKSENDKLKEEIDEREKKKSSLDIKI